MKKIVFMVCCIISLLHLNAQTFEGKGSKYLSIGVGMARYNTWYQENQIGLKGKFNPISTVLAFQAEFGVGKYIGVGLGAGIDYCANAENNASFGYTFYNKSFKSVNVPIFLAGNLHFMQLINELTDTKVNEKLDLYIGLVVGSGPSFLSAYKQYGYLGKETGYIFFVGPQLGIRYYPTTKFSYFLELGSGRSYFNGGICFKL
jgi:hypothetical protein